MEWNFATFSQSSIYQFESDWSERNIFRIQSLVLNIIFWLGLVWFGFLRLSLWLRFFQFTYTARFPNKCCRTYWSCKKDWNIQLQAFICFGTFFLLLSLFFPQIRRDKGKYCLHLIGNPFLCDFGRFQNKRNDFWAITMCGPIRKIPFFSILGRGVEKP